MARITAINVYPVKGCRGVALESARIGAMGFEHDREWLITRPDGRFMTQREEPRLALIEPALVDTHAPGGGQQRLRVPGGSELNVPLAASGREVEVTCWKDRCAAFDAGEEAAEFLAGYLGSPVRLVRFDQRRKRPSSAQWTQGVEALNQFSDGYPWLLICEASLEDLNSRLERKLPMNRFRPNIVVSGLPPYGEDGAHEFTAGSVRLRRVKGCTRCIVTTTDQAMGTRDGDEPLRTLAKFRFDRELKGVVFGQNLILIEGLGAQLRVGQEMTVTAAT
jgi:uncharacterized protein YcbX